MFSMFSYIEWVIFLIGVMAAIGAILLLLPQTNNRDAKQLREIRKQAEQDQQQIAKVLEITQHGARDSENILTQLKTQVDQANRSYQASQARIEQAERIMERVTTAEYEMRDISTQLGDRLQHLQSYWDEQLADSVSSVKLIRSRLSEGLGQVDDSISRLREQEKMAQGFTRKLIEHHQEQAKNQQENTRLSSEVHTRLEEMLKESSHLLEQMKRYQQDADHVFQNFNTNMDGLESQAQAHFSTLFQTTDSARHELTAGLEESREHLGNMRLREAQSDELNRRIGQQFEHLDHIRVERISKTLDLTEQMSSDLQKGAENARHLLSTLERAVRDVSSTLTEKSPEPAANPVLSVLPMAETDQETDPLDLILETGHQPVEVQPREIPAAAETDSNPHSNLVSLRAYR